LWGGVSLILGEPESIKKITFEEMNEICPLIREKIISTVSKNGGHLASNLGAVELTLALHRAFDFSKDKVVWDVGHQCYTHKLVTGRVDNFPSLRTYKGISGFPKRSESRYDFFDTGHSGTSVSAALGMAAARDIAGKDHHVIAVIGDGAMTGGMVFEALNHLGHLSKKLIVVLNDNGMSISPNVGGLSKHLKHITSAHVEENFFENIGFRYIGPVDGHDIEKMAYAFERAKCCEKPVVVHLLTKKGKGYEPAEKLPTKFHGAKPFDIATGEFLSKSKLTYSRIFADKLVELAQTNSSIVAITPAMTAGVCFQEFSEKFPERFFDVGIAEQHAVTFAAGISSQGLKPVVSIYSTFMQRAYDQISHDVCMQNLNVLFAVDRAGLVGTDGETHQGQFDISFLRCLPNMVVMTPRDGKEFREMIEFAINYDKGPISIRYPRDNAVDIERNVKEISLGRCEVLEKGDDVLIIAAGSMVSPCLQVCEKLREGDIHPMLVNARFVKPVDEEIAELAKNFENVVVVEENSVHGGLGSAVIEILKKHGVKSSVKCLGIPDKFIEQGSRKECLRMAGLDMDSILVEVIASCFLKKVRSRAYERN